MRIQLSDHFTYKKLLIFVLPSVVMMVFISIYSVVDGLFVSNFSGPSAVAAINLIFPLIFILGAIGFMLGAGGSALVSKVLGEGDNEKANAYFSLLVYATFAIGVVIAVAGQFVVPPIAKFFGAEGITYDYCVLYGRVLIAAQPFFILQNVFQNFFVTAEKPRLGLIVTAGAGVANMVLDAIFVAAFNWGLAGAAAATAVSQIIGGVVPVVYFMRKNDSLLRITKTKFYGKALLKSFANGSSEFLSNVSAAVVTMLYNFQIQRFVPGDDGVAAYGSIMYVVMIFFSVFMGYAVGSAPLIAYNYGADNRSELNNLFKKSMIITAVCGITMTVLSEALAYPFTMMFGYSGELFDMTLRGFRIYSPAFLFVGFSYFGSSLFTALNNGLISGIISFLSSIALPIAAVYIVPLILGLDGVWAATTFAKIISVTFAAVFIAAYRKKYGYM